MDQPIDSRNPVAPGCDCDARDTWQMRAPFTRDRNLLMLKTPRAIVAAGAVMLLAACSAGLKAGRPDSPTSGIALRMLITDRESSHALYVVDPSGTIAFGGGFAALDGRTTWSDVLSAEDIDRLRQLLDEHGWMDGPPTVVEQPEAAVCEVRFGAPGVSYRFSVRGGGDHVNPVRQFLEDVSRRRLEPVLERLPLPSERR